MVNTQQCIALIFIKKISLALCFYLRLIIMLENDLVMNIQVTKRKMING